MSKIDELIKKYCPDGVEYKRLGDCLALEYGKALKASNRNGGPYPVMGSNGRVGFHDSYIVEGPCILVGRKGSAGAVVWEQENCYPIDTTYYIRLQDQNFHLRFLYHLLQILPLTVEKQSGGVPGINRESVYSLQIPVPPLPVQKEIARILDKFTELEAELEMELQAELEARKKQYEYYRNKLLSFDNLGNGGGVEYMALGDIGDWFGGCTPSTNNRSFWTNGSIPWISSKDVKSAVITGTHDLITDEALQQTTLRLLPKNTVIIVARSGILKHTLPVAFVSIETTVNQDIKALVTGKLISPRYAYYAILNFSSDILAKTKKVGGTVESLDLKKFYSYKIPVPSLSVQKEIVAVLDKFDALTTDLTAGLPAELAARRKQYEYYRDKLLTFPKV